MANLKASKKDIRKSNRRKAQNHYKRSRLRTLTKRIRREVESGDLDKARETFREHSMYLDRAGRRRLIHPKQAARRKSRMARLLNKALAAKPKAAAPEPEVQEPTATSGD